jgi:DNA-binding transcriptional LysR family regulator
MSPWCGVGRAGAIPQRCPALCKDAQVAAPGSRDLDWDDLRIFLGAARAGSLAGAARAMGVEHTTVGRRLAALERALGAALVLRRPDGLALTPLGEKIAPLIAEVERAVSAVESLVTSEGARVRVAVPTGITRLVAPQLAGFRREHPGVALELMSGSRAVDLARGEADLAIRIGPVTDPDLVVRRVGEIGSSLYASQSYLARQPYRGDLAGHDVIAFDPSLAETPAAQWLEAHARGATVAVRCREMTELIAAAVSGAGVALLACWLADAEPALRRLTPDVVVRRSLSVVYRREAQRAAPVGAAIRLVTRALRDSSAVLAGAS